MLLNDRYEYNPDTDLIGKGGLAEVFKAYDRQRECYVALKKFNAADSLKYGIREEFQKSIQFAHGNIVRAFDFFTVIRRFEDGDTHETQYGVMELVEGGDLADYLKKKPAQEELLEVVKGILRGLDYLHTPDPTTNKRRIIHRDIKPGNILIFYNDEGKPIPKIADFNVAKEVSGDLESSVSMVGTYEYMAPEQLNVTKHGIDNHIHANADLWALGVILCDYFMGKSLFGRRSEGNTQGQIIGNILDKQIPAEVIRSFPVPFNGIIVRCLVRSAKDRAQSAKELLEYISSIEQLSPTVQKLETTVDGSDIGGGNGEKKPKGGPRPKGNSNQSFFGIAAVAGVLFVCFMLYQLVLKDSDEQNAGNESGQAGTNIESSDNPTTSSTAADPFVSQMVFIQGGTFMMGSPDSEAKRQDDEYQHQVTVSSFKMGKYEVSQAQWQAIMGNNPSYLDNCYNCPVELVSHDDIQEFLRKLNAKTGKKYRLPTEAEWEYAARGGTTTPFYTGTCLSTNQANYDGKYPYQSCSKGTYRWNPIAVGSFEPNQYGLYDMHGNVEEWCSDWYDLDYYENSPDNDPKGPNMGSYRVLRGGRWDGEAQSCRAANREIASPYVSQWAIGFRLVVVP